MKETEKRIENSCNMMGVNPALVQLPYPPMQVAEKNLTVAEILKQDYCGGVSELSAITQYIHTEILLSGSNCEVAKTILGIAMAEMIHLQKLGQLVVLLGGNPDYKTIQNKHSTVSWTPEWLRLPVEQKQMLSNGIASEKGAIAQYRKHMKMIKDPYVLRIIARIVKDEEYHIFLLQSCHL